MLEDLSQVTLFGNSLLKYTLVLAAILAGLLAVKIVQSIVVNRLKAWSGRTATTIDDFMVGVLEKTGVPLLSFAVFYLALRSLALNPAVHKALAALGAVLLTFYGVRFLLQLLDYGVTEHWVRKRNDPSLEHGVRGLLPFARFLVWGLGFIFLLDNLGVKVSTAITGLGIGGVAVALAAQSVLGDLFSYIAILFDKPFAIGDFIVVDDAMGTVEHIGVKTTRLRSLGGEQLVFSNANLTGSRIRNYQRMNKRRVVFTLGVTYETSLEKLKEIPALIKETVTGVQGTVFDRAHFAAYADSSLNFETVYYVLTADYNAYMDIQQAINFRIKEEFDRRGIGFAYPTRTVYWSGTGGSR